MTQFITEMVPTGQLLLTALAALEMFLGKHVERAGQLLRAAGAETRLLVHHPTRVARSRVTLPGARVKPAAQQLLTRSAAH